MEPATDNSLRSMSVHIQRLAQELWRTGETSLRLRMLSAPLFLIAAKFANVGVPILYKQAVDVLSGEQGAVLLPVFLISAYVGLRFLAALFRELREFLFAHVSNRLVRAASLSVFRRLHGLSLRFHLDRRTGGVSRAVDRGANAIATLLSTVLFNVAPTILELALVCGILWSFYNFYFALIVFVTVVAYTVYTFFMTQWRIQFRREMNRTDREASAAAIDSIINYETVKYFGNEEFEARRFDAALLNFEQSANKSQGSLTLVNLGQSMVISAGLVSLMLLTGRGVVSGEYTLGDFVMVNSYLIQLFMPLSFLGWVYRAVRQALADMEAMFVLLDEPVEICDIPNAPALSVQNPSVEFEGISFAYDVRRPILERVSFTIPAGGRVALVGPTGSGKSTVARLLFRFYDPQSGVIRVDGQDIRSVTQASLRANIGVVPQDTVLFNETIYYNIAYGRPDADRDAVLSAARAARIHAAIERMPDGYDTVVGERGLKLSGGEKQRVAIARTILKDPKILIFDEATSSLDTRTEQEIQRNLNELARNRTTLLVAHRLSTVMDADEILVLENAGIVERGSHISLLQRGGLYSELWSRQEKEGVG